MAVDISGLASGQRIFVAGASNEPTGLLEALRAAALPEGLHFIQFPLAGFNQTDFTAWHPSYQMTTPFMAPHLRDADLKRLHFLPMGMRGLHDYLEQGIDVALIQVARDRGGRLRLGPNADFAAAALASAQFVLAECNTAFAAPAGCPPVDEARLDVVLDTHRPLFEMPAPRIDETATAIGQRVAALIRDGDCIQTGIGAIPAAILASLKDKNDLGLHGGLIDDGGMALIRQGTITGANKPIDRGHHVTGMALGSSALIRWLADAPEVVFKGANYTHETSVIRQLPGFVSINSAVEVDLMGQVNAEVVAGRQISGTGGSVDFMRAARFSRGGRSIIAMTATARRGTASRIVPRMEVVTALRTDVDIVVTEYGTAHLRDLPLAARAEALIAIAAPEFREELRQTVLQAAEAAMGFVPKSMLPSGLS